MRGEGWPSTPPLGRRALSTDSVCRWAGGRAAGRRWAHGKRHGLRAGFRWHRIHRRSLRRWRCGRPLPGGLRSSSTSTVWPGASTSCSASSRRRAGGGPTWSRWPGWSTGGSCCASCRVGRARCSPCVWLRRRVAAGGDSGGSGARPVGRGGRCRHRLERRLTTSCSTAPRGDVVAGLWGWPTAGRSWWHDWRAAVDGGPLLLLRCCARRLDGVRGRRWWYSAWRTSSRSRPADPDVPCSTGAHAGARASVGLGPAWCRRSSRGCVLRGDRVDEELPRPA